MKIAIVHELLTIKGGAENVLQVVASAYPEADIYTLLYNKTTFATVFPEQRIHKSALQKTIESILILGKYIPLNHHLWLPFFSTTIKKWDFSEYDVVISFSSSFAHQIQVPAGVQHVCYVHSPARYLWDRTHDVLAQAKQSRFGWLKKMYLAQLFHRLRTIDASIEHKNCTILAASQEVQRRIELYWRETSTVLYPAISNYWLQNTPPVQKPTKDYFLIVSTLAKYKRVHLAIAACNTLQLPLKIIGSGAELTNLKKIAGPTIHFFGHCTKEDLKTAYYNAKAVIFAGLEDFGLVPLEAMSQGTPVIAFKGGGALETITEGVTGTFFDEPTSKSLEQVLQNFDETKFQAEDCRLQAAKFTEAIFLQQLDTLIHKS